MRAPLLPAILCLAAWAVVTALPGCAPPAPPEVLPAPRPVAEAKPSVPLPDLFPTEFRPLEPGDPGTGTPAVDVTEILETDLDPLRIPPLDAPTVVSASAPGTPSDDAVVLGVVVDGKPRAYPLEVLLRHWAANDVVDGRGIVALYDPISGAAAAYWGSVDGSPVELSATGLFYRGNALFACPRTQSLAPAATGRFITGSLAGRELRTLPYRRESWKRWRTRYPETRVAAVEGLPPPDPPEMYEAAVAATPQLAGSEPDHLSWVLGYESIDGAPEARPISSPEADDARVLLPGGVFTRQVACRAFAWRRLTR